MVCLSSPGSMLSSGQLGDEQLIRPVESAADAPGDPLQIASELLAFGQTDQAQETLENGILAEPERLDLHQALLEIHHHIRDRKRTTQLLRRLAGSVNPARKAWQELIHELDEDPDKLV